MGKVICKKCDYEMIKRGKFLVCVNPECGRSIRFSERKARELRGDSAFTKAQPKRESR